MIGTVRSPDGTEIAFDCAGEGRPVVCVGGALTDRSENAPLAAALAASLFAVNYDRRGRGASGDAAPYDTEREVEDLEAVIREVGGNAHLFAASSGAALALAAAHTRPASVLSVAIWEAPFFVDAGMRQAWLAYVAGLREDLAAGDRDGALARFMRLAGSGEAEIAGARGTDAWRASAALAHTLRYDAAFLGDATPPVTPLTQPVLVMTGAGAFFSPGADALAAALPHAERCVLPGQGHVADPAVLAPALVAFYSSCEARTAKFASSRSPEEIEKTAETE